MGHNHHHTTTRRRGRLRPRARGRRLGVAFGVSAAVVLGAAAWASAASPTVGVATSANLGTVLADAQGFALYTLPSDHNGMSTCTGPCIPVWPALTVPAGTTPTAGPGVTGTVAAVLQSTGSYQVTYNGSPLYTFVGDTSPGEASGNNVGGFLVVKVTASTTPTTAVPAPTTASTTPSSATTTPASAPTPTSSPASGGSPSGSGTPAPAPVGATASSTGGNAVAPATSPAPSAAPTALAVTGPGPGLLWIMAIGAGLVTISLSTLAVLGDRGRLRRTARSASRAARWLVGR